MTTSHLSGQKPIHFQNAPLTEEWERFPELASQKKIYMFRPHNKVDSPLTSDPVAHHLEMAVVPKQNYQWSQVEQKV